MVAVTRTYLDHAASAPLHPAAREAMVEVLERIHGNPSSPHAEGRAAKDVLEDARTRVAGSLRCRPREVVFTGSGTEAAQIGLRGAARARAAVSRRVVVSVVEHPAVLEAAEALGEEGFTVARAPVDTRGRVDAGAFLDAVGADAAVAALMLANHETGAVMPVAEVGRALRARGIPLLCDAALAPGRLPFEPDAVAADLVVLSGHKFGGPKGIGALYVRRRTRVEPLIRGGLQEERLRPGTEHVAGAAGFAVALERAVEERPARAQALAALAARFLGGLEALDGWSRVGPPDEALPGLVTVELDGVEGEAAMINLDLEGFAVATGSTCALGGTDPSPSLLAMGLTPRRAASTVRVTFGEGNTDADAERAAAALVRIVQRLRSLASL